MELVNAVLAREGLARVTARPALSRFEELDRAGRYLVEKFAGKSLMQIRNDLLQMMQEERTLYDGMLSLLQAWRDSLPPSLTGSEIADRLDEVLQLRDLVDQLAAAELPKGFGRD
jgi:hypothetical protein